MHMQALEESAHSLIAAAVAAADVSAMHYHRTVAGASFATHIKIYIACKGIVTKKRGLTLLSRSCIVRLQASKTS